MNGDLQLREPTFLAHQVNKSVGQSSTACTRDLIATLPFSLGADVRRSPFTRAYLPYAPGEQECRTVLKRWSAMRLRLDDRGQCFAGAQQGAEVLN